MKFTLKRDYQTNAVREALSNLKKARKDWYGDAYKSAYELNFDADPGALDIGTFPTAQEGFRFFWDITRRKVVPYDPALWVWAISLRRLDV